MKKRTGLLATISTLGLLLSLGVAPAGAATAGSTTVLGKHVAAPSAKQLASAANVKLSPGEFVISAATSKAPATATPVRAKSGASIIVCVGKYDNPHPGSSSKKRSVNAHLIVKCTGPNAKGTKINVGSRMTDGKRLGKTSKAKGNGSARVGGDLSCVAQKRAYRAYGVATFKYPAGYTPATGSGGAKSAAKAFRKNAKGLCTTN
ncbi:MAG: hypothetical protein LBE25_15585 [Arthrobacter sp.]|jgi:hypothetical protein|nr:hypothetical protein [Arthrobacter sp.]